jgi:hypothetical protein
VTQSQTRKTQTIHLTLSPQAEKYARRDAPVEARRMAARGALPLEPLELATVLFALLHDADSEVKSRAKESLSNLPGNVCFAVLSGPAHPGLLSYLAHVHQESEEHLERLALNPATSDSTIAFLASLPVRRVIDIIAGNQERMLRCEAIVEALGANSLTGRAQIERIMTFLGLSTDLSGEQTPDDMNAEVSAEDAEAAVLALLGEDMAHMAGIFASESDEEIDDEALRGNLFAALQNMSVMQKIKLARVGGKEARTLLIRDRNKIVSAAVITSPKMTESEVITIAQNRSTSDEILRTIANNRDWTKNYQTKLALATNPKTPQPTAIKFLNYLQDRELKAIMKSKNVAASISTHARRILHKKGKL